MEQIIRELSEEMSKRIESQRNWVKDHYTSDAIEKYETVDGKLELLDKIIKANWIQRTETLKLQCLGVTLGDVLVQELKFRWIEIEDEYGIDPAIKLEETSIILFPLTMISKRIEKSENIDIYELYKLLKDSIEEIKKKIIE